MSKIIHILIALALLAGTQASAGEVLHTLEELQSYAAKHSPKLRAEELKASAARERTGTLGYLPEPMAGVRFNGYPAMAPGADFDQQRYFINQTIPLLNELNHRYRLGLNEEEQQRLSYRLSGNQLRAAIADTYYTWQYINEQMDITRETIRLLQGVYSTVKAKYVAGQITQAQVLQTRTRLSQLDVNLLELKEKRHNSMSDLAYLAGLQAGDEIRSDTFRQDRPLQSIADIRSYAGRLVAQSIAVNRSRLHKQNSELQTSLAGEAFIPDLTVQLEYWDNNGGSDQWGGQVMLSLPWLNGAHYARLQKTRELREAAEQQYRDSLAAAENRITQLLQSMNTAVESFNAYRSTILPDAEAALSSARKAFETDMMTLPDLLTLEADLYNYRLKTAEYGYKYHRLSATLDSLFMKGERHVEKG